MNKDFENEIIAIARSNKSSEEKPKAHLNLNTEDNHYLEVIDQLFSISQKAADIYNSTAESDVLSVSKLPKEFLEMFLEIPGRRGGFCIISTDRLVIFFDEDPDLITVIGKTRNNQSGINQTSAKTTQLLKASFSNKEGKYEYRDNTGGVLDPHDLVSLIIRWLVSG